jgi:hypothetical protein
VDIQVYVFAILDEEQFNVFQKIFLKRENRFAKIKNKVLTEKIL